MAEYTQGEWELRTNHIRPMVFANGNAICVVTGKADPQEAEANANLIAAAPKMLAALEGINVILKKLNWEEQFIYSGAITSVSEAILSAKGEDVG